jgi:hypothetical protein
MPTSITADLADTRRLLFARVNALENVLRKLVQRVALLEERQAAQTRPDPPETSNVAEDGIVRSRFRRRAVGSQLTLGGMSHREDLEAWRD